MIDGLDDVLVAGGQPGLTELRNVLLGLLDGARASGRLNEEQTLKRHAVYRLEFEVDGAPRAFVVKRLDLPCAERNERVATRWLPAVGLDRSAPALLGVAADRAGGCVWHVYEDLGDQVLDTVEPERRRVEAAVDVIADLHVRFAEHALLPECRMYGHDLGMAFYVANVRDAIRGLECLPPSSAVAARDHRALRDRLLRRLYQHLDEVGDRAQIVTELGGPETLLHGDLWPQNILAVPTPDGLETRLIDWDKTGVGPLTYDLSTFLYRFSAHDRPWILDRYLESVAAIEWRTPSTGDLNLLLETAEISRIANCLIWPCIEAARARAAWTYDSLAEIETWFDAVEAVPAEDAAPAVRGDAGPAA